MNPIDPWLDPIQVRQLAERLIQPRLEPVVSKPDADFGDDFVGYVIEPASQAPEPPTAGASLLAKMPPFYAWLSQHFAATGIFLVDREGQVIFDNGNHQQLHFLARSLALAPRRSDISTGTVHLKITGAAMLALIPLETAAGHWVLAALIPQALSPAAVSTVSAMLAQIANPTPTTA